ncbi:UDP-galactose transporter [Saccharomycopsis crataegensis]|uniref:UDP-galactose transporter homolog 1 n=1 Tax=Saccharomycopsis crataegensis TaxID=43959 RepID=A0AAV5QPF1_9ASCO|nr:UDP-galactose transporter [Saccharomycopsis crataegensis]
MAEEKTAKEVESCDKVDENHKSSNNIFTLVWCVIGIYSSFLSWSYFHERVSSTKYNGEKFQAPLFIQLVQNFFAFIIGLIYLNYKFSKKEKIIKENDKSVQSFSSYLLEFYRDKDLINTLLMVSITQSISTPVGNSSLNHIDFVTYLLGKSCKLIPVLIIHTCLYKRKFPLYKYLIAVIITFGVFLFSYKKPSAVAIATEGNSLLGMGYLFLSLILDGLTNSTQDQMFRKFTKMTGIHLMVSLNFISLFLVLFYSIVITDQLSRSIEFISQYPDVFYNNILWYAICGSIGQIFIFLTLESFDSMILITINVTRKMFSMILSLIIFNHPLNGTKVLGIFLVFFGISLESYIKLKQKKTPK